MMAALGIVAVATMLAALPAALTSVPAHGGSSRSTGGHSAAATTGAAATPTVATTTGVATPDADNVSRGCQLLTPSTELGPTSPVPAQPVSTVISPSGGVWYVTTAAGVIYVLNSAGLTTYSPSGKVVRHDALPASIVRATSSGTLSGPNGVSQPVVNPSGDIYISSYYGRSVVEIGPAGQVLRTFDPAGGNPTNIFALHSAKGAWELGVSTTQRASGSYVYDPAGVIVGSAGLDAIQSSFLSVEPGGDILYAIGNGLVQTWDADADHVLSTFGSTQIHGTGEHTAGPLSFYYPDQAVRVGASIYTADGLSTMTVTQPDGLVVGTTTLGGVLSLDGNLAVTGNDLVAQTGPPFNDAAGTVSVIPIANVTAYLDAKQSASDVLGWGAGLRTGVAGDYYPPGTTPTVTASFASWWTALSSHLRLTYEVWNNAAINAGRPPASTSIHLPATAAALAKIALPFPTADRAPGPYEVEARLWNTSTSPETEVGATCLPVAVGAPGDRLDFSALPTGAGSGGPEDPRGVALNAQLGLTGLRSLTLVDWSTLLPDCNGAQPTAATCGAGALQLSHASTLPFRAAGLAAKDHVRYWLQVSGGDPVSLALVKLGLWQGVIHALVAHYSHVPAGCTGCAPVNAWEPWNEANNTGWANAQQYVQQVLEPFYDGAKAAQPGVTVIGGSSLEPDIPWWTGLIAAGGLKYLDVAAVHPYTGSNDSWEEDGMETQLIQLKALLGDRPLWLTEVGWWSNGDFDFTEQADAVARAMIWQRVIGIPVWNYFFDEGAFGNNGISFSLIQAAGGASGDDFVKPAALAVMAASKQLAGRPSLGASPSGIPQTWDERFGPVAGGNHDVAAVWSDALPTTAALSASGTSSVPVTLTTEYGSPTNVTLEPGVRYALGVSDQVVYISYPSGDHLSVSTPVAYGPDLALPSSGAAATATSGTADAVLDNPEAATGYGEGWTAATTDAHPVLTVTLGHTETLDRVIVDTQSVGSVAPGVRSYTLSAESPSGTWTQVSSVTGEFRNHEQLLAFTPVEAVAVRINISTVNLGGYYGGGLPPFCTLSSCSSQAFLHSVEIYAGSATPTQIDGAGLKPL